MEGKDMIRIVLMKLRKGRLFRLAERVTAAIWVKGDIDKRDKKFKCYKHEDKTYKRKFNQNTKVWICK